VAHTRPSLLPFTMVTYCATAISGGNCADIECPQRHDIIRCELCECAFPIPLLEQHQSGRRHLRALNAASNGSPNPRTPPQSLPFQPGYLDTQLTSLTRADPPVTVSDEGGLEFFVEGMGDTESPSFSSASHTIFITKTDVRSHISMLSLALAPLPNSQCELFL
jgi:hypothetical protein